MPLPTPERIVRAMSPSHWDLSNDVLYAMCARWPSHTVPEEILAKVLLIGRVYAAAIERRKQKSSHQNDRFYTHVVAPKIQGSPMDQWLGTARNVDPTTPDGLRTMVAVHAEVTRLFKKISKMQKRSLASKYLHFHVPKLFFIYDSRAVKAMREFSDVLPRASRAGGAGDNEYRKFADKAASLVVLCEQEHGLRMTPRQLDNLLLASN